MKTEHVRKLVDTALEELSEKLAQGCSEAFMAYLSAMARFSTYSTGNLLLLLAQRPKATRVAGYRTWQRLGRQVKRGERGIAIVAPIVFRRRGDEIRPRGPPGGESERSLLGFKPAYVFDVAQTEGRPLPEPTRANGDPHGHTERLKGFVTSNGIKLEYSDDLGPADGFSSGGRIVIRAGLPPAEEFSVLCHEAAHELLHRSDEGRKFSKTVKESEAEAVAFVVSQAIGLDAATACSDYIQAHLGDRTTLVESLERIQKTAAKILEAITTEDNIGISAAQRTNLPIEIQAGQLSDSTSRGYPHGGSLPGRRTAE